MESLANNHAFVDGNKRVAFFVTDTFLRMDGRFINCDNDEAYAFFMRSFRFTELKRSNPSRGLDSLRTGARISHFPTPIKKSLNYCDCSTSQTRHWRRKGPSEAPY